VHFEAKIFEKNRLMKTDNLAFYWAYC